MIKMTSDRPLLIRGEALTEFETDEQHARELELKGMATRVGGKLVKVEAEKVVAKAPPVTTSETVKRDSPQNRDNFEREPVREKVKGQGA